MTDAELRGANAVMLVYEAQARRSTLHDQR